jgi:predicted dehydrogenase
MVHKATHHFDLVNWWINSTPSIVFGFGNLSFYGKTNGSERGEARDYFRSTDDPAALQDPYALNMRSDAAYKSLYLDAEGDDGYIRDRNVFAEDELIDIEDDMAVVVRYKSGATMTYHLTAYSPWEGYRIMFNGTKGRLEAFVEESGWTELDDGKVYSNASAGSPTASRAADITKSSSRILLRPLWSPPVEIEVPTAKGGHGGGDARLLEDVFVGGRHDPLGSAASHVDGARSILIGVAANRSFETGMPVNVNELVRFYE